MAAVEVDVASATCKRAGCPHEAAWSRGKYAGLCTVHATALAAADQEDTDAPA